MNAIINDELINKVCLEGLFAYLSKHCESILVSGKKIVTLDASKNPQRNETYLNISPKYVIETVIQDLYDSNKSSITFDVTCCLYEVSETIPSDSWKIEVNSKAVVGTLLNDSSGNLTLSVENISFQPK